MLLFVKSFELYQIFNLFNSGIFCQKFQKYYFNIVFNYQLCYNLGGENMPIVSQFYGIIIRIYFNDTEKHYLEHFMLNIMSLMQYIQLKIVAF